eukprot:7396-Chlamydomonas_euryale.AAC.1
MHRPASHTYVVTLLFTRCVCSLLSAVLTQKLRIQRRIQQQPYPAWSLIQSEASEGDRGSDSAPDTADTGAVLDAQCARCADKGTAGCEAGAVRKSGHFSKKLVNLTYFINALAYVCAIGSNVSIDDAVAYMAGTGDPVTLQEALEGANAEEWLLAVDDETNDLIGMDVYEVIDRPPGVKLIPVKWVFKTKFNAFGIWAIAVEINFQACLQFLFCEFRKFIFQLPEVV